jgi:nucleotide-binding universal stress UspA family protein
MYRTILVPLDGSRFGEHALPIALAIARRAGGRLLLAHAEQPSFVVDGIVASYAVGTLGEDSGLFYLRRVLDRLAAASTVPVHGDLLKGPVAGALHEHALGVSADLVVMTTHGRGPLSRFWLGSVADELIRRLPMPLLLVRPGKNIPELSAEPSIRRVLVPLDGSPRSESALARATDLGHLWEVSYTLLQVVPPAPPGEPVLAARHRGEAEAQAYLDGVAARLRQRGFHARGTVVVADHAAPGILGAAEPPAADLIALATRGHGGLKRLLLGSVADKVLRGAATPVLIYRPLEK